MAASRMLHELVTGPGAWRFRILSGRCSVVDDNHPIYTPLILDWAVAQDELR